jgi:hypothetical protein
MKPPQFEELDRRREANLVGQLLRGELERERGLIGKREGDLIHGHEMMITVGEYKGTGGM